MSQYIHKRISGLAHELWARFVPVSTAQIFTADGIACKDVIEDKFGRYNPFTDTFTEDVSLESDNLIYRLTHLVTHGQEYVLPDLTGNVKWTIVARGVRKNTRQILASSSQIGAIATWIGEVGSDGKWGIGEGIASAFYVDMKATWVVDCTANGITGTINGFGIANTNQARHNTWALFASSVGNAPFSGEFFSARAEVAGEIVRDFIPVRIGETGYLLDISDWMLYPNVGSGAFGLGDDVFPNSIEQSYISVKGDNEYLPNKEIITI